MPGLRKVNLECKVKTIKYLCGALDTKKCARGKLISFEHKHMFILIFLNFKIPKFPLVSLQS